MYNYNIPHKLDSLIMNKNKAKFSLIIWLFFIILPWDYVLMDSLACAL